MLNSNEQIKVGISSCLLGEKVRFDSGHKKNQYVVNVLAEYFEFISFCPEVDIGLGIPRETIRLVEVDDVMKCIGSKTADLDVTEKLTDSAERQKPWHTELSGYILKKNSPSCGMERVRVYKGSMPERKGIGIYAKQLIKNFPQLPMEEEGRLGDPVIRENFIQRVFIFHRWKTLMNQTISLNSLYEFHAQHKYIYMSHCPEKAKNLGRLIAGIDSQDLVEVSLQYLDKMMEILRIKATKKNHVNTLNHIQGYLKKYISAPHKKEMVDVIEQYRLGFLPLIVPITLLRHHFNDHPNEYITKSFYLKPHPSELMLLNSL
jgi:uncharacterized protein YbgA (DUF1722 family)/uncharacterized protein YbbK (DUF523 family)